MKRFRFNQLIFGKPVRGDQLGDFQPLRMTLLEGKSLDQSLKWYERARPEITVGYPFPSPADPVRAFSWTIKGEHYVWSNYFYSREAEWALLDPRIFFMEHHVFFPLDIFDNIPITFDFLLDYINPRGAVLDERYAGIAEIPSIDISDHDIDNITRRHERHLLGYLDEMQTGSPLVNLGLWILDNYEPFQNINLLSTSLSFRKRFDVIDFAWQLLPKSDAKQFTFCSHSFPGFPSELCTFRFLEQNVLPGRRQISAPVSDISNSFRSRPGGYVDILKGLSKQVSAKSISESQVVDLFQRSSTDTIGKELGYLLLDFQFDQFEKSLESTLNTEASQAKTPHEMVRSVAIELGEIKEALKHPGVNENSAYLALREIKQKEPVVFDVLLKSFISSLPMNEKVWRSIVKRVIESDKPDFPITTHKSIRKDHPRVLNANFSSKSGKVVAQNESLQPGKEYDFLVDVGLPWNEIPNLLGKKALFPEDGEVSYLSTQDRQMGWFDIEVFFISQDFTPNLVSGLIHIPVESSPFVNGNLAHRPDPLKLSLRTPNNWKMKSIRAYGQLCLYYGAQVLQSAVVDVGVRPAWKYFKSKQTIPNRASVDYVLTPGFENVGPDLSQRKRARQDGTSDCVPVKVGLMVNDSLSGTHRILLKVDDKSGETISLPPAWKAYDPIAISQTLAEARRILVNPSGKELDYKSKTYKLDKFRDDLIALAKLGAGLYGMLLQGITPANNIPPLIWRKRFRDALQPGDVIQLARAGSVPSTHVIPWALVYDYPIELDRSDLPLKLCRVVDEQWGRGFAKRKEPFRSQESRTCPYEHEHAPNTICPFGFWGYKYTLEQPISALLGKNWDVEPARRVLAGTPIQMAVASTSDVPRENERRDHFISIRNAVNAEYIPTDPAIERDQVRDSLRSPNLVYILCHGGKKGNLTYLSIGPNDKNATHTITSDLPGSWGENDFIDLEKWQESRPLIFINGCFTTDLLPELTLNFVSAFRDLMAGGVIGTEVNVRVADGYMAAEKFFERFGRGEDIGQAILGMRWDLLNEGSLLGLAYTPYAMSDLHLEKKTA